MGFLIFIWNLFVRLISLAGMILMETMVFGLVYLAIVDSHPVIAGFLGFLFIIWIIAEVVLRVVVGGGMNVLKYIIGRFL